MIKENRLYLDKIVNDLKKCSKKDKIKATLFTITIGLLLCTPIICLAVNFYMQLVTIKIAFYTSIAVLVVIFHILSSVVTSIYYLSLGIISNYEIEIKYSKLFLAYLYDFVTLIVFIILGVIFGIIVNYFIN